LIVLVCGVNANVIRFLFPLTIGSAEFDEGVQILADAMREASTHREADGVEA
jgi:4-aminobutyrate aminotransferase